MYRSLTKCVRKKNIIMFFDQCVRVHCQLIFSSIAIELNVPCDDFKFDCDTTNVCRLGTHGFKNADSVLNVPRGDFKFDCDTTNVCRLGTHGFKNADSVLYDICAPGTRTF